MADLVMVLVIALLLLWLLHGVNIGSIFGNSTAAATPYIKEIGAATQTAIKDIQAAGGNTAKSLGALAHNVENGIFNGYASATKHSTVSVPAASSYEQAIQSQLYSGTLTGENIVTGPAAGAGSGVGSAPFLFLAGLIQGATSSVKAANTLPAVQALDKAIKANPWINFPSQIDQTVVHGAESAGSFLSHQGSNLAHWLGF